MTARRSFLARIGAVAAGLGLGSGRSAEAFALQTPQAPPRDAAEAASPKPRRGVGGFEPDRHEKDDWMELPGKHRLVFDGTSPEGVKDALQFTGNFFTGNKNGYGLEANDVAVVIVMRHRATQFVFTDAIWGKYGAALSESEKFVDPKTNQAPTVNVYKTQIENNTKRGVHIAACDLSTHRLASFIARKTQGDADAIYKEMVANAMPNVHFVPAGVVAVARTQERGYAVSHAG
jgi:intracellular sulfur oxidation DsrE/DsrF family protein